MSEFSISIILFIAIVIALVAIILFARSKLVPSGNVKIEINGKKTIEVPVGGKLLNVLADNKIFIPSACGGGGSSERKTSKKRGLSTIVIDKQKVEEEEDEKDERFGRPPFHTAPYIHQLNVPKHAANVNRAMRFSEKMNRCVHWIIAHDFPLHPEDQARFF